jgi:N-acetylmuramoyl-L-alanine amidase
MARIVVDPGHGGAATILGDSTWNNAVGPNGTLEKNLTLDVGLRVDKILRDRGHDVRLTRSTDVNLRLRDRAKVARDLRAHAFVSIHFNGSIGHNAQGTETLVHTNFSRASAKLSLSAARAPACT